MTGRVLITTANHLLADALQITLERAGLQVIGVAHSEAEAVALAQVRRPEAVVSTSRLRQGDGGTAARRYAAVAGCIPLFVASHPSELRLMRPPPCLCSTTVLTAGELLAAVDAALHWRRRGRPPAALPNGIVAIDAGWAGEDPGGLDSGQDSRPV